MTVRLSRLSVPAVLCAAGLSALTLTACVEDPLALDAKSAPGASAQTRDFTLRADELPAWRDTSYVGFLLPNQSGFRLISNTSDRSARIIGTLNVPDTIKTFSDTLPALRFDSVTVRLAVDTVDSRFTSFPVTFRMVELKQGFQEESANWVQAAPGQPWTTPGGDLGIQLASTELTEVSDSIVLRLDVSEDSLMKAWRESDGEPGFIFLVEGPETVLNVRSVIFRYEALLQGREVPVNQTQQPTTGTFIIDPPPPPIGLALRMGGLPATRFYIDFEIPSSLDGIPLEDAVINHAELVFTPLPPPAAPFPLEKILSSRLVKLLADPFVFGEKTPIGTSPLTFVPLAADSLATGRELRYEITVLILRASRAGERRIRLGFRGDPDGQTFGFWEFGSIESVPALRPRLRIIITPPPKFEVPG
ncbi:MAG: hypothetical protein ACC682_06000 [Gemmatimonadota bacterium]